MSPTSTDQLTKDNQAISQKTSSYPVPLDRISDLYNNEIFTPQTAAIARSRIHWMCSQCVGERVLDVGCSQGITAILLAREGFEVTGLDTHPEAISYAQKATSVETIAVQKRLQWIEGDLADLSLEDQYDTVVIGEVIEHQAIPLRFLTTAFRYLNEGGRLVLTTPFGIHPHEDHKSTLLPSHLVSMALDLQDCKIEFLDVAEGYIRMTLKKEMGCTDDRVPDVNSVLHISERGTLDSQATLYGRLTERSDQLKKKTELLKKLQKDLSDLHQKHGAELKVLIDSHQKALQEKQSTAEVAIDKQRISLEEKHGAELKVLIDSNQKALQEKQSAAEVAIDKQRISLEEKHGAELKVLIDSNQKALQEKQSTAEVAIDKQRISLEEKHGAELKVLIDSNQKALQEMAEQSSAQNLTIARQAESYQHTIATLEAKALAVKQTISFRLGNMLLSSIKSPSNFMKLPAQFWRLRQESKTRRVARSEKAMAELGGKSFEDIVSAYSRDGFSAVTKLLATWHQTASIQASTYTALARHLLSVNPAAAGQAAKSAYQADPKPFRAKWLAFRLYDAGVILEAAALLEALPSDLELSLSETKKSRDIQSLAKLFHAKPQLQRTVSPAYTPEENRLLYVAASALPYHTSGYTTRTHALVRAFSKSGVELSVITRPGYPWDRNDSKGTPGGQSTILDNIEYHHIRHPSQSLPLDLYFQEAAQAIASTAKKMRVAVIHAASNHVNALPALMAARQLGIPFHYEMRGLWELTRASKVPGYEQTERFKLGTDLEAYVATNADRVYVISPQLGEYIQNHWGVTTEHISLLPNCINDEDFKSNTATAVEPLSVGYAGSLVPYEGLDVLINAVKLLAQRDVHVHVKIIGDGESRTALEQQVKDMGLTEQIKFLGKLSPKNSIEALAQVGAVCIPRKPHKVCEIVPPIKLVEAMALGKPVIVPDLPVFRSEVEADKTGYFFKSGDAQDLAKAIETCLTQPENAKSIGANGRNYVLSDRLWGSYVTDMVKGLLLNEQGLQSLLQQQQVLTFQLVPSPADLDDAGYLERWRSNGVDEVIKMIQARYCNDDRGCARELLRVGKFLREAECEGAEYPLAMKALEVEHSESILKGFFWASQRTNEFIAGCNAILALEKLAGITPTDQQKTMLAKLMASPAYLLSVLKLIKPKVIRQQEFVPNRICYVLHNSLPYSSGGYATRSHGVATGLRDSDFEVIALTRPGFPNDIKPELNESDTPECDVLDSIKYVRTFSPGRSGLSALQYMIKAADAVENRLRQYKPEIVIAASNHITSLPALIAARRLGIPFIYEVRGFWEITRLSREPDFGKKPAFVVQKLLEAAVAKEADHVFTLTEPMREELVERGVARVKIDLLPNSCDSSRFVPRKRDDALAKRVGLPPSIPVIGYIGTFVGYEGLDDLASACALLKSDGIEFRLLLVGNENTSGQDKGPITEQIASIAVANGFSEWLIMPGRIPHEEVESYYSLMDICPFPRKPLLVCEMVSPMKPLEALAMGKAVVVSSVRALVEMIQDEKTGLVFEKGNIASLAMTFTRLIESPSLRAQLGGEGRKWVERERTWAQAGKKVAKLISELTGV